MKRLIRKTHHHLTKMEIFSEEVIIIILFLLLMMGAAVAASVVMPIRATVIQCGPPAELEKSCRKDIRCCDLLDVDTEPLSATAQRNRTPVRQFLDKEGNPVAVHTISPTTEDAEGEIVIESGESVNME